jgi:transglutaminase-like putative cysteine protease
MDAIMKHLRIHHCTRYNYHQPVKFGPHRALVRPREGHDVHIESSLLHIKPSSSVRWLRDTYGNSIAMITFLEPSDLLEIDSEVMVAHYEDNPLDFLIEPEATTYPFQYSMEEAPELIPYKLPSYPRDGGILRTWLEELYKPGQVIGTFDLLSFLNRRIHDSFRYEMREEHGVQRPSETLQKGSGSCRDYAVLMMEAVRHWGFGARFVTGYVQMAEGQHGATHAWTEIYIPGAGWRGFDPTNDKMAGADHVSVAVARDAEKASPVSGFWSGPVGAFSQLDVKVSVVQV